MDVGIFTGNLAYLHMVRSSGKFIAYEKKKDNLAHGWKARVLTDSACSNNNPA